MDDCTCSFPGCDKPVKQSGLCNGHCQQRYKGKPLTPLRRMRSTKMTLAEAFQFHMPDAPPVGECWLWSGVTYHDGYGKMTYRYKAMRAHRVAYEIFVGPIPPGAVIMHTCDVPLCCNPAHLRPGSVRENVGDMHTKKRNRQPRGATSPNAKLTEQDVRDIRKSVEDGVSRADLARRYKMAPSRISEIVSRRAWAHVV